MTALLGCVPGTFSEVGSMSTTRYGHNATLLHNGKVLICSSPFASAELYDPSTNTFSVTGSTSAVRLQHTLTLLQGGRVLITGGFNSSGVASSAEVYDPSTNTFGATGSMITARYGHTATLLQNGKVLVVGGFSIEPRHAIVGGRGDNSSAEIYDPSTNTFSATSSMTTARASHTATLLQDGKVLITGGFNSSGVASSAEIYDPSANTFSAVSSMTAARFSHTATLLQNGKVLITGGFIKSSDGSLSPLSSAELYDPSTNTLSATDSITIARYSHTTTFAP
jgi:N-acetylneuraminic acid mutarotase